jgi:hypothetical protein
MNPASGTPPTSEPSGNGTILYLEGNTLIGTRLQYCCGYAKSDGSRHSAFWPNTAYFCPTCGEIWARAILQPHFNYQPIPHFSWVTENRRCPTHGDGTLLAGFTEANHLSCCSLDLLKREALLLCLGNPK